MIKLDFVPFNFPVTQLPRQANYWNAGWQMAPASKALPFVPAFSTSAVKAQQLSENLTVALGLKISFVARKKCKCFL